MENNDLGIWGSNAISSLTLKDQAYNLIKEAILYHKLQVGTVYSQDVLCNELGISRTPVREALLQLEQEGYVAFLRGKGFEVVPITGARAAEMMEARYYLEQIGSRLAAIRRRESDLERMDDAIQEMQRQCSSCDAKLLYQLDRSFHLHVFEAAGNNWILNEIEYLRDHFLRFETLDAFDNMKYASEVIEEHQVIVDAIREKNPEKAEAAMKIHLEHTSVRTASHLLPFYENGSLGGK